MDLKGRNFLTLKDFTPEEITYLLDLSAELKEKKKKEKNFRKHLEDMLKSSYLCTRFPRRG